jgi:hypothetical protein
MTLLTVRDPLEDLLGDHPWTRQDNQVEEDLWVRHRLMDRLVLHLQAPRGDHHHLHLHRLLETLHQVPQESFQSLSYQHRHTKRSPMSKRQKTSPRQGSGIVSDDRPSSTLRKIDEISTMTKRLFNSC